MFYSTNVNILKLPGSEITQFSMVTSRTVKEELKILKYWKYPEFSKTIRVEIKNIMELVVRIVSACRVELKMPSDRMNVEFEPFEFEIVRFFAMSSLPN